MRGLITILGLVALSQTTICWAQLAAPNEKGVAMGHLHLNVRDVQAEKKFWILLGGVPANQISANANREVVKFPGVLIAIAKQKDPPTGGSVGSVVDHVGFHIPNIAASVAKWKAAGLNVQPGIDGRKDQAFVISADGLKIEMLELPAQKVPIEFHHVHFYVAASEIPKIQEYYIKTYGGIAGKRGPYDTANIPGAELTFAKSDTPTAPTKGRVLDHIGFEVTGLESFAKKMEESGIKFVREYRLQEGFGGIAVLTDPWGAAMELTEGQRKY